MNHSVCPWKGQKRPKEIGEKVSKSKMGHTTQRIKN